MKLIAGLGALFLYGSLGVASGVGDIQPVALQEMSDEEKERRREECARLYEHCYDWCGKAHKRGSRELWRCNEECSDKNTECMKKIPN